MSSSGDLYGDILYKIKYLYDPINVNAQKDKTRADVKKMLINKEKNTDLFLKGEASYEKRRNPLKFQTVSKGASLGSMSVKGINREVKY